MESQSGDDNSPLLNIKEQLLKLPAEIRDLELSLHSTRKLQMTAFIDAEKIKERFVSKVASDINLTNDIKRKSAVNESLLASVEYQTHTSKYQMYESTIKTTEIQLYYLDNMFAAYRAIARMD